MSKNITIMRADGTLEAFKPAKLRHSLEKAGASDSEAKRITTKIAETLKEGMTTREIYRQAFQLLKQSDRPSAARFSIKQAIMALGPSGYPFEQILGRLLENRGYSVTFPEKVKGRCATHEIDVVGEKKQSRLMIEAKFHKNPGFRTDIKTALYVKARYDDVAAVKENRVSEFWLVTNAKFSSDAREYAACAGLKLLGWNYPIGKGIEEIIATSQLQPITILTTLNNREKRILLENNLVICSDLESQQPLLRRLGFNDEKIKCLLNEIQNLPRHT